MFVTDTLNTVVDRVATPASGKRNRYDYKKWIMSSFSIMNVILLFSIFKYSELQSWIDLNQSKYFANIPIDEIDWNIDTIIKLIK